MALFAVRDLLSYFIRKGWATGWPGIAKKLRCEGCGRRSPGIAWQTDEPPPEDPVPPRPRLARTARSPAPLGISEEDWAKARDDRERRRLIRIVRG